MQTSQFTFTAGELPATLTAAKSLPDLGEVTLFRIIIPEGIPANDFRKVLYSYNFVLADSERKTWFSLPLVKIASTPREPDVDAERIVEIPAGCFVGLRLCSTAEPPPIITQAMTIGIEITARHKGTPKPAAAKKTAKGKRKRPAAKKTAKGKRERPAAKKIANPGTKKPAAAKKTAKGKRKRPAAKKTEG